MLSGQILCSNGFTVNSLVQATRGDACVRTVYQQADDAAEGEYYSCFVCGSKTIDGTGIFVKNGLTSGISINLMKV